MKPVINLIYKGPRVKYSQYKGDVIRLNKSTPSSVEEVIIGINEQKTKRGKIITFRDSNGNIIERIFDFPNRVLRNRLYSQVDNTIGADEYVESKTIKEYTIDREAIPYYKDFMNIEKRNKNQFLFWDNKQIITNHMSYNVEKNEIIQTQTKIKNKQHSSKQTHTFIEFPRIKNGEKLKADKKELSFTINRFDNSIYKKSIKGNVELPYDDSYLGYRALTIEDAKIPFVKKYLKEQKMDDKDIIIRPRYNPIHEDNGFSANFNAEDGSINFNQEVEFYSKSRLANTSRHEVEHVRHYFLQGLLNHGDTSWQTEMSLKFGEIKDKKILKEAKNYDKSIKTYVPYYVDSERYKKNYIEIKAKEKGREEQEKYDFEGQTIRRDFKHIPPKLL